VVMDIFMGAGTVGLVAKKLNRRYIGCDLNAEYVRMAEDRINGISYTLFSLMEVTGD
jgi:site-specific DNA-methyltransferase (adenine-specific)